MGINYDYDYDSESESGCEYSMPGTSSSRDANNARECLKKELIDKITHDDSSVFRHICIEDVDEHLVQMCQQALETNETFLSSRERYEQLRSKAEKRYESGILSKKNKKAMMEPLTKVITLINNSMNVPPRYKRQWVSTGGKKLVGEAFTFYFPQLCPDFTLRDVEEYDQHVRNANGKPVDELWRHRLSFLELKPTNRQSVGDRESKTVTDFTAQAADYARLHISARPFQLFSIGLLVFGSKFCVGIFDRDGVRFSSIYGLWDNINIFIRVIRRLTADMSPVELGQEPNVDVLPLQHNTSVTCRQYTDSLSPSYPLLPYPTYSIRFKNATYYTIGFPIWTAVSLLGRGTTVWRVSSSSTPTSGSIMIMKTSWRKSGRLDESEIHRQIKGKHDGLVEFADGMDVIFPQSPAHRKITTANLRHPDVNKEVETTILHRLFLKTDGRPLWEFDSFLDFFLGVKAALQGHEFLASQGILHRDISAGNMLLSSNPNAPDSQKGFLADFEFARLVSVGKEEKIPVPFVKGGKTPIGTERTHLRFQPPPRGAVLTGTVQFMAYDLLVSIQKEATTEHRICHDIESFIWVIFYVILRRIAFVRRPIQEIVITEETLKFTKETFHTLFGHVGIAEIRSQRYITPPWHLHVQPLPAFLDNFLKGLHDYVANTLRRISIASQESASSSQAKYADLIRFLDSAIKSIRQQAPGMA